jgi:hypothetical protein
MDQPDCGTDHKLDSRLPDAGQAQAWGCLVQHPHFVLKPALNPFPQGVADFLLERQDADGFLQTPQGDVQGT